MERVESLQMFERLKKVRGLKIHKTLEVLDELETLTIEKNDITKNEERTRE